MIEYLTKQYDPSYVNWWINHYSKFGWILQSSQEVRDTITDVDTSIYGDTITVTNTTTNYITCVFKRDTNMPNYAELVKLQKEYDTIMYDLKLNGTTKGGQVVFSILSIFMLFASVLSFFMEDETIEVKIGSCIVLIFLAFLFGLFALLKYKKGKKLAIENGKITSENIRRKKRRTEIYRIAQSLL